MKKLLVTLLTSAMAISFIGCGSSTQTESTQPDVTVQEEQQEAQEDKIVEESEIEQKEIVEEQEEAQVETQKETTRQEKIQQVLAFTDNICKRNFDTNGTQSKVEYIHQDDIDIISVTLKQDGLALAFGQCATKNDYTQWDAMVASIVKCSGSNQKAVDEVVDKVFVQYQVVNDLNEDNVLIATLGGGLFYDISTEYRK